MLNLVHVRSFVAVVDRGGFGAAAEALGLAQPTVSQHVRKLEEALEAPLLVRRRERSLPTEQGRLFLPHARGLLALADRATDALGARHLAVGAGTNVGVYLLQPFLHAFEGRPDGRRVELAIGPNPEILDRLRSGGLDMAATEWWDGTPGFAARVWRREPLVAIVGPGHAWAGLEGVTVEMLGGVPLVGGEAGTGTGTLLRARLGPRAERLRAGRQLGSTEAVKRAVRHAGGVSLVLAASVEDEVRHGSIRALPVLDADLAKDLYVVLPEDLPETAPAARFARMLEREGALA